MFTIMSTEDLLSTDIRVATMEELEGVMVDAWEHIDRGVDQETEDDLMDLAQDAATRYNKYHR